MALSYKVFPGTPYYSNTNLTTKAGEIVNTTAATYVNTTYGTVSIGGSTYYVAYGMMVSFWNSSYSGTQIDNAIRKVLSPDSTPTEGSENLVTSGGVKSAIIFVPETGNAGFHNSIYRGKYLGSSVTAAQYAEISAGTFDDLFIGDYWTINSVNWRIAAFDYWMHKGDTECTTHHVVIVPDSDLATAKMNSTSIATGGYLGSDFYTGANSNTGRATAIATINSAFGSSHILTHREYLTNAVTNGYPSGGIWTDATVELMNEINVYGCMVTSSAINGTSVPNNLTIDYPQFALFRLAPQHVTIRSRWWLRDVATSSDFALVSFNGTAASYKASNSQYVRPAFGICA